MALKFAPFHRYDRNFYLLILALIWLGLLMGFVPEIVQRARTHTPPYAAATPYHAIAFISWLVLLTVQLLLVRAGSTARHRRLGRIGFVLVPVMVMLGTATAFQSEHRDLNTAQADPAYLSLLLCDMVAFGVMGAAGLCQRRNPVAHKRLMLLSAIMLTDAGFGRWWGGWLFKQLGNGFWPFWTETFLGPALLIFLFGLYDFATRKRLQIAFVWGSAWIFGMQALASGLYGSPWWKNLATRLIIRLG